MFDLVQSESRFYAIDLALYFGDLFVSFPYDECAFGLQRGYPLIEPGKCHLRGDDRCDERDNRYPYPFGERKGLAKCGTRSKRVLPVLTRFVQQLGKPSAVDKPSLPTM